MSILESLRKVIARVLPAAVCAILALSLAACSGKHPDPVDMVPPDAAAWLTVRSVERLSGALRPLVARVPELGGAVDMVKSVTGIDLAGVDVSAGLDYRRGTMAALWRDGLLVVLPVSDAGKVRRGVSLKLARFGFAEVAGNGGLMEFDSADRGHACLAVKSGLALLFVGPPTVCASLPALADPPKDDGGEVRADPVAGVESEMGGTGFDAVFRVSNKIFAPEILRLAGLPTRGAAALVARGFIGDLRGVVRLDSGVSFRVAAGASGGRFVPSTPSSPAPGPVSVDVTAGPSVRPIIDTAISLAARRVKGLDTLAASWSGVMRLVAVEASSGAPAVRGASRGGLLRTVLDRFDVRASVGLREDAAPFMERIVRLFGTGAGAGTSASAEIRISGVRMAASGTGNELLLAVRSGASDEARANVEPPGLPALVDGPRVAALRVDPEGIFDATGFASVDFLKHIVDPLDDVTADIYYEGGRVLVDGGVHVR